MIFHVLQGFLRHLYLHSHSNNKEIYQRAGQQQGKNDIPKKPIPDRPCFHSVYGNLGEVLGVLDRAKRIHRIDKEAHIITRRGFLLEVKRMTGLGLAIVTPIKVKILINAWKIMEKHHIYEADAL
ncbi:hypothetical protein H5T51_00505, partial [Candidatus Bathyarchaeota archaeon]|nr:hypothetical protein [Candidatus Bathyarchaeota archaeon]